MINVLMLVCVCGMGIAYIGKIFEIKSLKDQLKLLNLEKYKCASESQFVSESKNQDHDGFNELKFMSGRDFRQEVKEHFEKEGKK